MQVRPHEGSLGDGKGRGTPKASPRRHPVAGGGRAVPWNSFRHARGWASSSDGGMRWEPGALCRKIR